ncbi:hypothetical protein MTR67_050157 [Solanum verrucosum]|uniref:Uncharacterized protein n=1 Tax=Solanum verrucosum TaxID=315347 RepID=A0AAF0V2C6_SOLVR|nr:hypothetical protein MTR67_050157 [Solanum verrucosum]
MEALLGSLPSPSLSFIITRRNPITSFKPYQLEIQETGHHISLSSVEVEYRSLRKVVGELIWLHRLFTELTIPSIGPSLVYCDSHAALHIAKNPVFYERTKHIEVDCHFVRSKLQEGLISLHHINNCDQLADILTKALTGIKHTTMINKLAVVTSLPT